MEEAEGPESVPDTTDTQQPCASPRRTQGAVIRQMSLVTTWKRSLSLCLSLSVSLTQVQSTCSKTLMECWLLRCSQQASEGSACSWPVAWPQRGLWGNCPGPCVSAP